MADAIRILSMEAVHRAKSGHQGMPMGMSDVATVLWTKFLRFDPKKPDWADRDRFVLSAGHGSMLLYSLLHLTGYADMSLDELKRFRQLGSKTAGHPEYGHASGIETTTGRGRLCSSRDAAWTASPDSWSSCHATSPVFRPMRTLSGAADRVRLKESSAF